MNHQKLRFALMTRILACTGVVGLFLCGCDRIDGAVKEASPTQNAAQVALVSAQSKPPMPENAGDAEKRKMDALISELEIKYPVLNEKSSQYNQKIVDEALSRQRAYIRQGQSGSNALQMAVDDMVRENVAVPTQNHVSENDMPNIYTCRLRSGKSIFSDSPCPEGSRTENVRLKQYNSAVNQQYAAPIAQGNQITPGSAEDLINQTAKFDPARAAQLAIELRGQNIRAAGDEKIAPTYIPAPEPATPPTPSIITNCDPSGCWDNLGGRYNSAAGGNFIGPSDRLCINMGGMIQCH